MKTIEITLSNEQYQELSVENGKLAPIVILDVLEAVRHGVQKEVALRDADMENIFEEQAKWAREHPTRRHTVVPVSQSSSPAVEQSFDGTEAPPAPSPPAVEQSFDGTEAPAPSYQEGLEPTPERDIPAEREYMQERIRNRQAMLHVLESEWDSDTAVVRNARADVDEARKNLETFEKAVSLGQIL